MVDSTRRVRLEGGPLDGSVADVTASAMGYTYHKDGSILYVYEILGEHSNTATFVGDMTRSGEGSGYGKH